MDGPPPTDPSVLDGAGGETVADAPAPAPVPPSSSRPINVTSAQPAAPVQSSATPPLSYGQQQARQLLSSSRPGVGQAVPAPGAAASAPAPAPAQPVNDLFSLDFHAPPSANVNSPVGTGNGPQKDVKQDILSLFSSPSTAATISQPSTVGAFGSTPAVSAQQQGSPWDAFGTAPAHQPVSQQSMVGTSGAGMWGVSSGWTQPIGVPSGVPSQSAQGNIWGSSAPAPQAQSGFMNTNDIWGGSSTSAVGTTAVSVPDCYTL
jgi:stromal membrane-associated protein